MESVPTVDLVATFGGAAALVWLLMSAFGKPIIRRVMKIGPGAEVPEGSSYPFWVNVVAAILGIALVLVARTIVDSSLTLETGFNAVLVGLFAGLSGTGASEVWGNSVTLLRR